MEIARHPTVVSRVVAHEPPLLELLLEAAKWRAFHDDVYETYQREGTEAAMQVKPGDVIEVYLEEQL